jgi:hypothetical protein
VDGRGSESAGVVVFDADFAGEHGDKYRTAVREAFCYPTLAAKAAAKVGHPAHHGRTVGSPNRSQTYDQW